MLSGRDKLTNGRQSNELCRPYQIALFILSSIIASYGFGNKTVYECSTVLSLSILIVHCLCNKKFIAAFPLLCIFISSIFKGSILQCSSLLALAFFICNQNTIGASFLLSHAVPYISYFVPSYVSAHVLSPWVSYLLFGVSLFVLRQLHDKLRHLCIIGMTVLYGVSLMWFAFERFPIDKCPNNSMPGYNIGNSLQMILEKNLSNNGQIYYGNQESCVVTNSGTVFLDHDSCTIYDGGVFTQKSPWSRNSLIAVEPFRVNVAEDGCLVMNIGSRIANGDARPVWGLCDGFQFAMLCAYDGDRLIFGDSDLAGDMLAPYQVHLWRHIAGKDIPYRLWMFVIGVALILYHFTPRRYDFVVSGIISVMILIFHIVIIHPRYEGGIRYVGYDVLYPHTSLCYGLVREMHKIGSPVLFTRSQASVLAVGTGHTAKLESEKLVILEANAGVYVKGKLYKAGTIPLGVVDDIVDARDIFDGAGHKVATAAIEVDGVLIIATGSPSSQDLKRLL